MPYRVAATIVVAAVVAYAVFGTLHDLGWRARSARAEAVHAVRRSPYGLRVESEQVALERRRPQHRRFEVVEERTEGDRLFVVAAQLSAQRHPLGTSWRVVSTADRPCAGVGRDAYCMYRVDERAVVATITMDTGDVARTAVRNGYALFFLDDLHLPRSTGVWSVTATDSAGAPLARLTGRCQPLLPPLDRGPLPGPPDPSAPPVSAHPATGQLPPRTATDCDPPVT